MPYVKAVLLTHLYSEMNTTPENSVAYISHRKLMAIVHVYMLIINHLLRYTGQPIVHACYICIGVPSIQHRYVYKYESTSNQDVIPLCHGHMGHNKYTLKATTVISSMRQVTLHHVRSKRQVSIRQTSCIIEYASRFLKQNKTEAENSRNADNNAGYNASSH